MRSAAGFLLLHWLLAAALADVALSPNPVSRALPVVSLVESGTLHIDALHHATEDKARVGGHYYSDKAPGASLVVAPAWALLRGLGVAPAVGSELGRLFPVLLLGAWLCGALPFAALLLLADRRLGSGENRSGIPRPLLVALPFYGSCLFVYSGVFYGHLLAALLLLLSWRALASGRDAAASAWLGVAVLTEFTTAAALPAWALQLLRARPQRARALLRLGLGGAPLALLFALYNRATTGSPFELLYAHEVEPAYAAMSELYGLRLLDPLGRAEALFGLLVGPARGALVFVPVLGLLLARRLREGHRSLWLHPLAVLAASYLLVLSSYYMWWGGWAYGPRHLIPPLALLLVEGVALLARSRVPAAVFYGLCGFGLATALAAKATTGELLPERVGNPLLERVLPRLLAGDWNRHWLPHGLGLDGGVALGLWLAAFAATGVGLARLAAGRQRRSRSRAASA